MLLSSLLFYKLFFKEIKFGCNKKTIAPVVEARESETNKFLPEANFYIVPLLISTFCLVLLVGFYFFMITGFETMMWYQAIIKMPWYYSVGILFVLILLLYYSIWQNWLAILWIRQHRDEYFVYIGKDGVIRTTRWFWVFIPWEIIDGAEFEHGQEFNPGFDYMTSFRNLKINLKGHTIFTPNFIKGHGGGNIFDDWVEYSDDDMKKIAELINDKAKS